MKKLKDITPLVNFDEAEHRYTLQDGKELVGVTTLMKQNGLSPDYSSIPQDVLMAAAARGTELHQVTEMYDAGCDVPPEWEQAMKSYAAFKEEKGFQVLASEYMVSDLVCAASFVDAVLAAGKEVILVDKKRTSAVHRLALEWQLSIYAYLFEKQTGIKVKELLCWHWIEGKQCFESIKVKRIPDDYIAELLRCQVSGDTFISILPDEYYEDGSMSTALTEQEQQDLMTGENAISQAELQLKKMKEGVLALRSKVLEVMKAEGLKTISNGKIKYTYISSSTRNSIDSARLKKEMPDIAQEYTKSTLVNESLRLTIIDQ